MMSGILKRGRIVIVAAALAAFAVPALTPTPAAAWWQHGSPGWRYGRHPGWRAGWHPYWGPRWGHGPAFVPAHWNGPYWAPSHWG